MGVELANWNASKKGAMMRRAFTFLMALMLVAGFAAGLQSPTATIAQDAPGGASVVNDSSGAPLAEISVDSIAAPFEDYDDFSTPQRGFEFILLTVTITNVGDQPYSPQAYSFLVVDTEGFIVTPGYVSYEEGVAEPQLTSDPIEPGASVTGTVVFEVLSGSELAAIVYQPSWDRYTMLAASGESAAIGDTVDVIGEEGGVVGTMTVEEFIDPLEDVDPSYQAQRGYHHAGAVVTVENSSRRPLSLDPYSLQIIDTDGYLLNSSGVYRGEEADVPNLEYADLAPGDSVTGMATFELFNDAAPAWMIYNSGSSHITFLATFPDAPAVPAIEDIPAFTPGATRTGDEDTTPEAVSAECSEVADWSLRTEERFNSIDDTAVAVDDPAELEDVDIDALFDFLDQFEQIRDEQAEDTPPAIAEDTQTATLALLDLEIELINAIIDAKEDGDDISAVVDEYEPQMEEAFNAYFESFSTLIEECPNLLDL